MLESILHSFVIATGVEYEVEETNYRDFNQSTTTTKQ